MDVDVPSKFDVPSPSSPESQTVTVPPSERIAELNAIDHSVSTLLKSAATATSVLSNQSDATNKTLSSAQATFQNAANQYFSTLSSIEVRLRRQVYALEEAGLIPAGDERDTRRGRTLNSEGDAFTVRTAGGPLDPSWLNARVSEGPEVGMKRDVLARARQVIEEAARAAGTEDERKNDGKDVDMEDVHDGEGG